MPLTNKPSERATVLSRLVEIIEKMPVGEQYALLDELRERASQSKRKHRRLSIRSRIEYTTREVKGQGFIQNISQGGVFIETRMPFRSGEDLQEH